MTVPLPDLLGLEPLPAHHTRHLIVPWALVSEPELLDALQTLPASATGHLQELLRGMQVSERQSGAADSLNPPHERALAQLLGWGCLPDGLLPWAARCAPQDPTKVWAWISLCHWAMGREQASLSDPQGLQVSSEESEALMQSMRPYFASEGIDLQPMRPGHWLGCGQALGQATASLDRVIGRTVDPWLPAGPQGRLLRRLQNEMQMLLYTHPVNQARGEKGQQPINSIWFSGSGQLPAPSPPLPGLRLTRTLAAAAMSEDPRAYAQAWAQLDREELWPLLEQQRLGHTVSLTLCGERSCLRLQSVSRGLLGRMVHRMTSPAWTTVLREDS